MGISIKSPAEITLMRRAGRLTGLTLRLIEGMIKPGVTTGEINKAAEEFITTRGGYPTFKGYRGFPKAVCISVNDEVIHGIPGKRVLREGDVVSVDIGATLDGFIGDAARTYGVGRIKDRHRKLIEATKAAFFAGAANAREGRHLHEICAAIQQTAEGKGFNVVKDFIGHGVGRELHESPEIPNYKPKGRGPKLIAGMTIAVEPMINDGTGTVEILDDEWTVVSADGGCSAHYENTILVSAGEPEFLTLYEEWDNYEF